MVWFYENLELFVFGIFALGVTWHFVTRRWERSDYMELRAAYEDAVREVRDSQREPSAVVREAELYRAFMNSWLPGWFDGFGRCLGRWLKVCAVFTLVAYFFKGPVMWGEEEYAKRQARAAAVEKATKAKVARAPSARR